MATSHVVALMGASLLTIATQGCATAYRLLPPPAALHRSLVGGYPHPGRGPLGPQRMCTSMRSQPTMDLRYHDSGGTPSHIARNAHGHQASPAHSPQTPV